MSTVKTYNIDTGDATSLSLKTNGTTAVTIDNNNNLNFVGTAQRITGDFSNATIANRVMFQSSTTNGITSVAYMPNGTATDTYQVLYSGTDPTNTSGFLLRSASTEAQINAFKAGTGTYLPMTFYTGGTESVRIDTAGNVGINTSAPTALLHVNGGQVALYNYGASGAPPAYGGYRASGTVTSPTAAASGVASANLSGNAYDGTAYRQTGGITINTEAIPSGTSSPGFISFNTTAVGAVTPSERLRIASDGSFSAVVPAGTTLYPGFWCRAWGNIDGTATPVTIRADGNISSITDNGTGDYTFNFSTAMPDSNYSSVVSGSYGSTGTQAVPITGLARQAATAPSSSAIRVSSTNSSASLFDAPLLCVAVFR